MASSIAAILGSPTQPPGSAVAQAEVSSHSVSNSNGTIPFGQRLLLKVDCGESGEFGEFGDRRSCCACCLIALATPIGI